MRRGLVKCPRNTTPYILVNLLKLFLSSSLNTPIIGTTFYNVVSVLDGNFSFYAGTVMCRGTICWGGRFDQLTNYCYFKNVTENTVANSIAAWLPIYQLSCKFENIGEPTSPSRHIPVRAV